MSKERNAPLVTDALFIGQTVRLKSGDGVIVSLVKSGNRAGMFKIQQAQGYKYGWSICKEPYKPLWTKYLTLDELTEHKVDTCPHCKKGKIYLVKGSPPAHLDYAQCVQCDSTYSVAYILT